MTADAKLVVGLTGGIGSGKSAVAHCFERLGITVIDADHAARVVVEPGRPALDEIAAHFGKCVLTQDGALDRAALRGIVFADPHERKWLESLLHPLIGLEITSGIRNAASAYTILASPLLLEAKQDALTHRVLVVDVSEETQIARTMRRDSNSEEQVRAIIAAQIDRAARLARADDVIVNEGTLQELEPKVLALHQRYLGIAAAMAARAAAP